MIDLNTVFVDEFVDSLESLESFILHNEDLFHNENLFYIFRIFHSLKGNAQSSGQDYLGQALHELEDFLSLLQNDKSIISPGRFKDKLLDIISSLFELSEILKSNQEYLITPKDLEKLNLHLFFKKIIVIDDHLDQLDIIEEILSENILYKLDLYSNSEKAMDALMRTKFDLIITDYNMPSLSGNDLVKVIKISKDHINEATPIIMISAENPPVSLSPTDYDNIFFMQKPFTIKMLNLYIDCAFKLKTL